jgi:hypothetical protein
MDGGAVGQEWFEKNVINRYIFFVFLSVGATSLYSKSIVLSNDIDREIVFTIKTIDEGRCIRTYNGSILAHVSVDINLSCEHEFVKKVIVDGVKSLAPLEMTRDCAKAKFKEFCDSQYSADSAFDVREAKREFLSQLKREGVYILSGIASFQSIDKCAYTKFSVREKRLNDLDRDRYLFSIVIMG